MTEIIRARNDKNRKLNILKNKKLVTILNHKMFKGYRDITASKWFSNHKPKYISQMLGKIKYLTLLMICINYKKNVLYPLKNPCFNNVLLIKNIIHNRKKNCKTRIKIKIIELKLHSLSSSEKNFSTIDSRNNKKKFFDKKNNFYLTSMSIYQTDNFYHDLDPSRVYKQIFENDKVIYNDIPILSLDKIQKNNNKTKIKKIKK